MNDSFLPDDYVQPETKSNYLKFKKDWDTEFRILSNTVTGFVYFNLDNKPVRSVDFPEDYKDFAKVNEKTQKQDIPKHFRAFVVWDYATKNICILEVTQKSIQNDIMAYYKNAKRGDPKHYDLTITRKWEWLDTKYTVIANPKTPVELDVLTQYKEANVNLEKLFSGWDPFEA